MFSPFVPATACARPPPTTKNAVSPMLYPPAWSRSSTAAMSSPRSREHRDSLPCPAQSRSPTLEGGRILSLGFRVEATPLTEGAGSTIAHTTRGNRASAATPRDTSRPRPGFHGGKRRWENGLMRPRRSRPRPSPRSRPALGHCATTGTREIISNPARRDAPGRRDRGPGRQGPSPPLPIRLSYSVRSSVQRGKFRSRISFATVLIFFPRWKASRRSRKRTSSVR